MSDGVEPCEEELGETAGEDAGDAGEGGLQEAAGEGAELGTAADDEAAEHLPYPGRVAAAGLVLLDAGHGPAEGSRIVGIVEGSLRHLPGRGEAGVEIPRLDETYPDTEAPDLDRKGLTVPFYRELRGGVEPLIGHRDHSCDGADIDDAAAALPPHVREDGRADAGHAHEIGLHLPAPLLLGGQLEGAADTRAGIVHQHVDASLCGDDFPYCLINRRRDRDVQAQHTHPVVTCPFLYRAARTVNGMTSSREHSGRGTAESGSGSCYQYYLPGLHPETRIRGQTLSRTAGQVPPISG